MELALFGIAFLSYTVAMALYIGYAMTKREWMAHAGGRFLVVAAATHLLSLVLRTYIGHQYPGHELYLPWTNWFECFSFFALVIALEYLIIQSVEPLPVLGSFVIPLIFFMLMAAVHSPTGMKIQELPLTLQSRWMIVHVPIIFASYAAFGIAFMIGLAFLIQERQLKSKNFSQLVFRLPPLEDLDALISRVILFAMPLFSVGLITGAGWAHEAWGRYWGWDAKEIWSAITWLIYAGYLYVRLVVGWRGRRTAYFSLGGFIVVIFTYVGVNYISTLHGFLSGAAK